MPNCVCFAPTAIIELELVMTGKVNRFNEVFERVASLAMRAKLCGFDFHLGAGEFESMSPVSSVCS